MKISEGPEQWQKIAGGVAIGVGVLALLFFFSRSRTEALEKPHEEKKERKEEKEEEKNVEKKKCCSCPRVLPDRRKQEWVSEAELKKERRRRQKEQLKELIKNLEECDDD